MIRQATSDDIETAVDLGERFHSASVWSHVPYDREAMRAVMANLIAGGVIFLSDDGFVGGMLSPLYFNPSVSLAAELFWWAPSEGRALRQAFEAWAADQGAIAVQFSGMADDRLPTVSALFKRAGYRPVETCFLKEF